MKFLNIIFGILTLILISCSPEPRPIEYGKDLCEHCQMVVAENKWGAELVNDKGKLYFFDSIECLIAYLDKKDVKDNLKVFSSWTVNYQNPGELIDCSKAFYLYSPQLHSPMGLNVASFKTEEDRNNYLSFQDAKKLDYQAVVEKVKTEW
jgi:copper chaperone NosL